MGRSTNKKHLMIFKVTVEETIFFLEKILHFEIILNRIVITFLDTLFQIRIPSSPFFLQSILPHGIE